MLIWKHRSLYSSPVNGRTSRDAFEQKFGNSSWVNLLEGEWRECNSTNCLLWEGSCRMEERTGLELRGHDVEEDERTPLIGRRSTPDELLPRL